jgi:hypothetical protein
MREDDQVARLPGDILRRRNLRASVELELSRSSEKRRLAPSYHRPLPRIIQEIQSLVPFTIPETEAGMKLMKAITKFKREPAWQFYASDVPPSCSPLTAV